MVRTLTRRITVYNFVKLTLLNFCCTINYATDKQLILFNFASQKKFAHGENFISALFSSNFQFITFIFSFYIYFIPFFSFKVFQSFNLVKSIVICQNPNR